jgi:hypothetical protein
MGYSVVVSRFLWRSKPGRFTLNAKPKQHGVLLWKFGYRETE